MTILTIWGRRGGSSQIKTRTDEKLKIVYGHLKIKVVLLLTKLGK